jgi:hypothetical protein
VVVEMGSIYGGADAAQDGDAERSAEFRGGLHQCRRRIGALGWDGADGQFDGGRQDHDQAGRGSPGRR